MKFFLLIFSFVLIASSCFAATNNILENMGKIKTMKADFTQTNTYKDPTSSKPISDVYTGSLNVIMNEKAIFEYTDPAENWYLFTKNSMETYDAVMNQLVKYKKESLGNNIFIEFLTDFSSINKNFSVKSSSDKDLVLSPKTDMGIKSLQLTVDNDGKLSSMKTEDNNGNITELKFKNLLTGIKIPDKVFVKKLPKDATIVEQ